MSGQTKELVAYVPVMHQGYLGMFERHMGEVETMWVMGTQLTDKLLKYREIRAIEPRLMGIMVSSLGFFKRVGVLEEPEAARLKGKSILMPDEDVSRRAAERFFWGEKVSYDSVFLRWNEANVVVPQTVSPDRESEDPFDRQMMALADSESQKSSDWWRRIGAVAVRDGKVLAAGHNQHEPTEQEPYINGDPRDTIEAGTHNLLYSSIHAEQLIVAQAAGRGESLSGADLYINVFPCPMCTKLMAHAGIRGCYFRGGSAWLNSDQVMRSFGMKIVKVNG